ncbi:MAG: glycoside hydrolase family 18 protein [Candidatus Glassbacteria bacterium]
MTRLQTMHFAPALLIIACSLTYVPLAAEKSFVLGYYPSGMRERLPADKVDLKILTHLCHAFITPNPDGAIHHRDDFLYPELVAAVHAAGRKILVSIGGGGGGRAVEGFPPVAADPALRRKFIGNLLEFCRQHGYDGIDFDWEYPRDSTERNNHALLVSELRQEIERRGTGLLITMANSGRIGSESTFDHGKLARSLDWFNVMTYDFHGLWSDRAGHNAPMYSVTPRGTGAPESDYTAVAYLTRELGIPREKLLLGLPFYGFELEASDLNAPCDGGRYIDYSEIVTGWAAGGWEYHWDEQALVPWLSGDDRRRIITFDNPRSLAIKCDFARVSGLRGVMIWALGQDVIEGGQPLLDLVGRKKWDFQPARR